MNNFYLATASALIAGFLTVLLTGAGDTRHSRRSRLDDAVSRLCRHYSNLRFDIELIDSHQFTDEKVDMREVAHALDASLACSARGYRVPSWVGIQRPAHGLHEVLFALDSDMAAVLWERRPVNVGAVTSIEAILDADRRRVKEVAAAFIQATLEWEASPSAFLLPARTLERARRMGREDRRVTPATAHRL